MVSLRLSFSFPQRPGRRSSNFPNSSSFPFSPAIVATTAAALAGATAGIKVALAISPNSNAIGDPPYHNPWNSDAPLWASLSLAESPATVVEPKTGVIFPSVVDGARRLLGIGLRKKNVFGLKNIDVYAFGVYAEVDDVKKLRKKYGVLSDSEFRGSKEFFSDVLDQDIRMTVKLQIVYGRLTIGSVRSAFEESVGNRLKKFSSSGNKDLLNRFTSLFRDEYKLPRGSVIDLSREQGYVLRTRIDGKEVGDIQSKLLCQSILDLYIGDDPFDKKAKEDFEVGLISLLQN
ncbi:fatty-acid-binding protein 1 [Phalaenopsis equestris]|uniref:fatty-acid-binding protein 1 n=1 Tax=Phalaenopsis equestris TaxID=78828 RepID=UPI0009E414A7|nr:fatty-acid-binding protein 1 [Phalaenopsis equestris]